MIAWLGRYLGSSLGKKFSVAVTGLLLVGFVIVHLAGNLLLFEGGDGAAFNAYADKLHDLGPVLYAMELGLLALFVAHIGFALRTALENRRARRGRYAIDPGHGERTFASTTMPWTGLVVLGFLVFHLIDFRLDYSEGGFKSFFEGAGDGTGEGAGSAGVVWRELGKPLGATVYLVGVLALGLHLSHAIRSAFQTFGANHPHLNPILGKLGIGLAVLLTLGFASLPVYALITAGGGPQ